MKKIFGIMLAAVLAMPVLAETDANADYSDWLPKAGDWNVQIGMDPKAIVMGSSWSTVGGFAAGYMVTDKIGIRASLGLNVELWNKREYAQDDAAVAENAFSKAKVTDTQKRQSVGGTFSLGVDWHVGSTHKVQGVFGAGLMYGVRGIDKYEYFYNNAISEYNQMPSTNLKMPDGTETVWAKFGEGAHIASGIDNARVLRLYQEGMNGPRQMVGMYLSAGLEWFVTPKMALGMNVSLNLMYQFMHAYTTEYEGWSTIEHQVVKWTEREKPVQDGFSFSTADAVGTRIYMSVYL